MKISCSGSQSNFEKEGAPFFLLGDTCWSAFTHPSMEEWQDYLTYRQRQGFNALQINILPQRHACLPRKWRHPFEVNEDGSYNFRQIQPEYFERAKRMLEVMREKHITPMLVLLWGNYVPGTWQQKTDSGRTSVLERPFSMVMPFEDMRRYVSYAVKCFKEFEPIWIISGDTNLDRPEPVSYYMEALRIAKQEAPECLTSLHLYPLAFIPEELLKMPELDFYMFQPGHDADKQLLNRELARKFSCLSVCRPAMNSEANYECNSFFNGGFGRFEKKQVRFAFWQSVLNGACAGFTYGAAGIWLWQRDGDPCSLETPLFPGEGSRWFDQAHDWRTDLSLPGGWDVSFGRWLIETFHAWGMKPLDGAVSPAQEQIAVAKNETGLLMIYTPCPTRLTLQMDVSSYRLQWVDLETRQITQAICSQKGKEAYLELPICNEDCLLIGQKV